MRQRPVWLQRQRFLNCQLCSRSPKCIDRLNPRQQLSSNLHSSKCLKSPSKKRVLPRPCGVSCRPWCPYSSRDHLSTVPGKQVRLAGPKHPQAATIISHWSFRCYRIIKVALPLLMTSRKTYTPTSYHGRMQTELNSR